MDRKVILLNGPSSSGKSTLAEAPRTLVADRRQERYEVVSIDDFMKTDPMETIYEDDVFEISGEMCGRALEILETGSGVIIDHVITSERIFSQLEDALRAYPLFTVRVSCPLRVLKKRERERGDHCPGSAEASAKYLYPKKGYGMTAHTGTGSAEENALRIYEKAFGKQDGEPTREEGKA